jgi:hypothetical protein
MSEEPPMHNKKTYNDKIIWFFSSTIRFIPTTSRVNSPGMLIRKFWLHNSRTYSFHIQNFLAHGQTKLLNSHSEIRQWFLFQVGMLISAKISRHVWSLLRVVLLPHHIFKMSVSYDVTASYNSLFLLPVIKSIFTIFHLSEVYMGKVLRTLWCRSSSVTWLESWLLSQFLHSNPVI